LYFLCPKAARKELHEVDGGIKASQPKKTAEPSTESTDVDPKVDPLRKFERFLKQITQWKTHVVAADTEGMGQDDAVPEPLELDLLSNLRAELITLSHSRALAQVSEVDISSLIDSLHFHVKFAVGLKLQLKSDVRSSAFHSLESAHLLTALLLQAGSVFQSPGFRFCMSGLEAAQCLLTVMSSPSAPKSALHEEVRLFDGIRHLPSHYLLK
jgi:hypothetical protein